MKLRKIPDLKIKQKSNGASSIVVRANKLTLAIKLVIVAFLLSLVTTAYIVGGAYYDRHIAERNQISMARDAAFQGEGAVISAAADIIVAESKTPPEVARKYAVWVFEAAYRYSVDPILLLAIMSNESKFNYKAISPTGPIGLMQIAATWHKDKITSPSELFDPKRNIFVGAQIVAEYGSRTTTDAEMLVRYNAQPGYAPVYAMKVLATKHKYDIEINKSIVESI